jgi:phosphoenolpyruvate carboxykinase (ATP)
MPMHPSRYAELLGKKLDETGADIWLVNTGWSGGPQDGKGKRMKIAYTRAMVNAVLDGKLKGIETEAEPFFGLQIPKSCPGVPDEILNTRNTWDDKEAYDVQAKKLAGMFVKNFEQYADQVSPEILAATPKV